MKTLRRLLAAEGGATLVEYALLLSLISLVVFAAVVKFGTALAAMYRTIAAAVQAS